MSRHIKHKKIHFTLGAGALIFLITAGVSAFKGTGLTNLLGYFDYLDLRARYAQAAEGQGLVQSYRTALRGLPLPVESADRADAVPVLLYHGIGKKTDRFAVTTETFRDQMFALKKAGYRTITIAELEAFLRGELALPKKAFLLTFDDGRVDSYVGADPVLHALDFHAVMYVAVEDSIPADAKKRQTFYISKDEIRRMTASGRWEVGSHAIQATGGFVPLDSSGLPGNFLSNRAWLPEAERLENEEEYAARLERELGDSKRMLEEAIGAPVTSFSYPFGDFGQQGSNEPGAVAKIRGVINRNYGLAFRQVWLNDGFFSYNRPGDDPYDLKRIETPTDWSGAQLTDYLAMGETKALPFSDGFASNAGWLPIWGRQSFGDDGMRLYADASGTGATVLLEGTHPWKDYAFVAHVARMDGGYLSLAARYQDTGNYLSCVFGGGWVRLDRTVGGRVTHLAERKLTTTLSDARLSIGVRGTSADCMAGGARITGEIPDGTGGVALKIWNAIPGQADVLLDTVAVEPIPAPNS